MVFRCVCLHLEVGAQLSYLMLCVGGFDAFCSICLHGSMQQLLHDLARQAWWQTAAHCHGCQIILNAPALDRSFLEDPT